MIGISLPFDRFDEIKNILPCLKELGGRRIELQELNRTHAPAEVFGVTKLLWNAGFEVVFHTAEGMPQQALSPLREVLAHMEKGKVVLIASSAASPNCEAVRRLVEYIRENAMPITVTSVCDASMSDTQFENLLLTAEDYDSSELALCLDIRHMETAQGKSRLSDKRLRGRMVHIRAADVGREIDNECKALLADSSYGYYGSYNVTLDYNAKKEEKRSKEALIASVGALKESLPTTARLYDDIRENFDRRFQQALTVWNESREGTTFSLIQTTAFLFCTNGFRWAMDIAFRWAYRLAKTPYEASKMLSDMQLMIISHEHGDHFEERTVRQLAQNETMWIIPDFLVDTALAWGIRREKILSARVGEEIRIGPLTVLPFEGRHFRPVTGKGVRAYGYHISAPNSPSIVFPGDTRNFSTAGLPDLPPADYCFANVWLGDKNGFAASYDDIMMPYIRYMLHFSQKNILLTHLYECGRRDEDMWRREHAELIADEMKKLSPDTNIHIPHAGDMIRFE